MREQPLLGAPGVYPVADEPLRALTAVRMDVAAFVGVAPRGPARVPELDPREAGPASGHGAGGVRRSVAVPIESWTEYRRLFGGFEGPGLLPYAVAAFFEQGGERCYVVRIVHDHGPGEVGNRYGTASGVIPGVRTRTGDPVELRARSEGSWGNRLRAIISFRTHPLEIESATPTGVVVPIDAPLPVGTLLRLWLPGGAVVLRFVSDVAVEWNPERPQRVLRGTLTHTAGASPERVEVVEAELRVDDGSDDGLARGELHERLGLSALHPRWMAAVLHRDSALVLPGVGWTADDLVIEDGSLREPPAPPVPQFGCGRDRFSEITPGDFFDPRWDALGERPGDGVFALAGVEEASTVVVPDLYSPGPLQPMEAVIDPGPLAGPVFAECVTLPGAMPPPHVDRICPDGRPAALEGRDEQLDGLRLDPTIPAELNEIIALQQRLLGVVERLGDHVVLLDVPPGLNQRQILTWRGRFASAAAAAYLPWLLVSRPDDHRERLIAVNPSAYAAGMIAQRENAFGVPHGPANSIAIGVVSVAERISPTRHDELHRASLNVHLLERDGVRLTAARTLSRDAAWRQLSVRRLMTQLRRVLLRQMQWTAFEPNDAALREELRRMLEAYLRQLYLANAFRGRTQDEAFFVQCDDELNPPPVLDAGRLVCHVGVAPVEPLEYLVLRLSREGDGTLRVG
jgi:uncharacterized protein